MSRRQFNLLPPANEKALLQCAAAWTRLKRRTSGGPLIQTEAEYLESKKISNDQELINHNLHTALKTKRERNKYINGQQFTKGTHGKPNEQFFPR